MDCTACNGGFYLDISKCVDETQSVVRTGVSMQGETVESFTEEDQAAFVSAIADEIGVDMENVIIERIYMMNVTDTDGSGDVIDGGRFRRHLVEQILVIEFSMVVSEEEAEVAADLITVYVDEGGLTEDLVERGLEVEVAVET